MKGYTLNNTMYVFPQTVGAIPYVGESVTSIMVQQEDLAAWKTANSDYASIMKAYNYNMMTVQKKVWADHLDDDIVVPEPEPETNSITGADFDDNLSIYGTITLNLPSSEPLVVEYDEEGDEYSPFEVANVLYISSADVTDSEKYSWTKDGEPIEGVEATGGDTEPIVYTYDNDGEDAPMFTVDEDENGMIATITPDTTGVYVATIIPEPGPNPEPTPEPGE